MPFINLFMIVALLVSLPATADDGKWKIYREGEEPVLSFYQMAAGVSHTVRNTNTRNSGIHVCSDDANEIELCDANGNEILDIDFDDDSKVKKRTKQASMSVPVTSLPATTAVTHNRNQKPKASKDELKKRQEETRKKREALKRKIKSKKKRRKKRRRR